MGRHGHSDRHRIDIRQSGRVVIGYPQGHIYDLRQRILRILLRRIGIGDDRLVGGQVEAAIAVEIPLVLDDRAERVEVE